MRLKTYLDCAKYFNAWKWLESYRILPDVGERELTMLEKDIQQNVWGEVKGFMFSNNAMSRPIHVFNHVLAICLSSKYMYKFLL